MSGEQGSREAQLTPEESRELYKSFIRKNPEEFAEWCSDPGNLAKVDMADEETRQAFEKKLGKMGPNQTTGGPTAIPAGDGIAGIIDSRKAPAVISGLSRSDPPKPDESQDVQYLSWQEKELGFQANTLNRMIAPDRDADPATHPGPWIEFCSGYNHKDHKHMVQRLPGRWVEIRPEWIVRYMGNVVKDHLAVHTSVVRFKKVPYGYTFDRFFIWNGKRLERCCMVPDRIHQAGLIYEKHVPKGKTRAIVRMKPLSDTPNKPMYRLVVGGEGDYRDLKRLFERHFMRKNDGVMDDDPALRGALDEMLPEISTEE